MRSCSTRETIVCAVALGRVFDWSIAQQVSQIVPKLYLAGGLSPENVEEAINRVHPYAVDACSSLEDRPGTKNHGRMRAFVDTVRGVKTTFPHSRSILNIAPSPENFNLSSSNNFV